MKTAVLLVVQQKVGKVAKMGHNKVGKVAKIRHNMGGKVAKNVPGSDEVRANDI